jgi:Ca2+-transporting ATPase
MGIYFFALARGLGEAETRTLSFTTIVIANLSLILTNRSWKEAIRTTLGRPNRALVWVFALTITCLLLVIFTQALQDLFRFSPVPLTDLLVCAGAGGLSVVWFEIYKAWQKAGGTGTQGG